MSKGFSVHCPVKNVGFLGCTVIHSFALACSVCNLQVCSAVCMNTVTQRCTMFTINKPMYKHAQINNRHIINLIKGLHISYGHDQCFYAPRRYPKCRTCPFPKNTKARVSLNFLDCVEAVEWWMKAGDTLILQKKLCFYLVRFFMEQYSFLTNRKCQTIAFLIPQYIGSTSKTYHRNYSLVTVYSLVALHIEISSSM